MSSKPGIHDEAEKKRNKNILKYRNHTLQTNPRHIEEESQNTISQKTPGRQPVSYLFTVKMVAKIGHKDLNNKTKMFLKRLSFGSKQNIKELKA